MNAAPQTTETLAKTPDQIAQPAREVASAIAENRLRLAYQPVVNATRTGFVAFHEALLRIETRSGEVISAGQFIQAVEGSELGRLLDRRVLAMAIEALQNERRGRLSINLSACGVGDLAWLALLEEACHEDPTIAERLIVEITETAELTLDARALSFLYDLRRLGASIALDDFGAGHTSMRHLGKFRFDFLKIDAGQCQGVASDPTKAQRFRAIIRVARHFDLVTIAEGVETLADAETLAREGADCLQGFYFGKPNVAQSWQAA